ncbi:MAG: DUF2442 domain-containing protein [Bacteroidota bacterium]
MIKSIKKIVKVELYKLTLEFNTGEVKIIDLEDKIKAKANSPESKYKQLLNPEYFKSVKLEPEWETIYWENGLDFCPDTLYSIAK